MVGSICRSVRCAVPRGRLPRRHRWVALAITSAAVLVSAAPAAADLQRTVNGPASVVPRDGYTFGSGFSPGEVMYPTVRRQPVTKAEIRTWTREYARYRGIPTHDISRTYQYAHAVYVPAAHTYWGTVEFLPAAGDSLRVVVGFQDGNGTGVFRHRAGKPWRFYGTAGEPPSCGSRVPVAVEKAFGWGPCPAAGLAHTSAAASLAPALALSSVSCPSVAWCMAVGYQVDQPGTRRAVVERWNGKRWALQSIPAPPEALGGWLDGVSCTSKNACTAVGATETSLRGNPSTPLVERWNGRRWAIQSTPSVGQQGWLDAVSCSSQNACTAVGESLAPTLLGTVIAEGWNGQQWVLEPTRFPSGEDLGPPSAVSCTSSHACMMVGIDEGCCGSGIAGIWNGTEWEIQTLLTVPTYKDSPIDLEGVSCTTWGGCVVVGSYMPDGSSVATVAVRWNAATDSVWLLPPPAEDSHAVSCTSTRSCTAVGYGLNTSIGAEHFNGREWVNQPLPPQRRAALMAVSCTSRNACTAVGQTNNGALIERWNGRRWASQHSPS